MSDYKAMRDRICQHLCERSTQPIEAISVAPWLDTIVEACESEVRRALQPRSPSPELVEAEKWLTWYIDYVIKTIGHVTPDPAANARALSDELDRLRAEISRLRTGLEGIANHDTACEKNCEPFMVQHARSVLAYQPAPAQDRATLKAEVARLRGALVRIGTDHCYSGEDDEECSKVLGVEDYCARCLALHALGGGDLPAPPKRVFVRPIGVAMIAQLCTEARREGVTTAEGIGLVIAEYQRNLFCVDPKCAICGEPATCYGRYEAMTEDDFACDSCCGHGNEDGHCEQLVTAERGKEPGET